jgi:hypothetical protein
VLRKRPELLPSDWIFHHDVAPAHKALFVKLCLVQNSITEMEHPSCSPNLAPNGFWLFPKIRSALKGRIFQNMEDIKCEDGTETYSTTGVPKMFLTVTASLG